MRLYTDPDQKDAELQTRTGSTMDKHDVCAIIDVGGGVRVGFKRERIDLWRSRARRRRRRVRCNAGRQI